MKAKNVALILSVVLFAVTPAAYADSEATDERPYMGILLDTAPLPDLLTKHLGLSPNQGVRIRNVHLGSPADKAGLERDDIIIGFQGKDVTDCEKFVDAVRKASVDTEVSLQIIHLGKRKTVKLKLAALKDKPDWKYPPEPEIAQWWGPGKMFRLKPGEQNWIEIEFPFDGKLFGMYSYHHPADGESCTITIEGDPDDKDTKITVRVRSGKYETTEYKTTVKEIDKLPAKYRDTVNEDLKSARKSYGQRRQARKFYVPSPPQPNVWRRYLENILPRRLDPSDKMFDKIEKRMRELQQRIEELERRNDELLERFSEKLSKQKSQEQENKPDESI